MSRRWVCGRSLAGIVDSNPAGRMDVSLSWVSRVVRKRSLRRADHSSREALPTVVCLREIAKPRMRRPWPGIGSRHHKEKKHIVSRWQKLPVKCSRMVGTQSLFDPLESISHLLKLRYSWKLCTPLLENLSNCLVSYDFPNKTLHAFTSLVCWSMLYSLPVLSACRTNISCL